jgi:hypothetical protein
MASPKVIGLIWCMWRRRVHNWSQTGICNASPSRPAALNNSTSRQHGARGEGVSRQTGHLGGLGRARWPSSRKTERRREKRRKEPAVSGLGRCGGLVHVVGSWPLTEAESRCRSYLSVVSDCPQRCASLHRPAAAAQKRAWHAGNLHIAHDPSQGPQLSNLDRRRGLGEGISLTTENWSLIAFLRQHLPDSTPVLVPHNPTRAWRAA